jgi:hypothetical protein
MMKKNIAIISVIVQDLWYHNPAPNPKPSLMQCNSGLDILKLHVQEPFLLHALRNMQWIEASSKQSWYISRLEPLALEGAVVVVTQGALATTLPQSFLPIRFVVEW